jgi:predicted CoA-binding protein
VWGIMGKTLEVSSAMEQGHPAADEYDPVPEGFDLKRFFQEIKTIAVVGYSDNPERAGHYVAHFLAEQGYEVIAINPKFEDEINGLRCYPSLDAIPAGTPVDVIDVFRAPQFVPVVLSHALKLDPPPKYFVMQPGAESDEANELAAKNGIVPLRICMMAAHKIWGA